MGKKFYLGSGAGAAQLPVWPPRRWSKIPQSGRRGSGGAEKRKYLSPVLYLNCCHQARAARRCGPGEMRPTRHCLTALLRSRNFPPSLQPKWEEAVSLLALITEIQRSSAQFVEHRSVAAPQRRSAPSSWRAEVASLQEILMIRTQLYWSLQPTPDPVCAMSKHCGCSLSIWWGTLH